MVCDASDKQDAYQTLETLHEYVLIEQEIAEVEVFSRQRGWQPDYYYLGDSITLQSVHVTVAVEELYYQVDIPDMTALA